MVDPKDILTGFLYLLTTIVGATIGALALLKRVKSQNMKDDIDTARKAMQMVTDVLVQVEVLRDRVVMLENILSEGKYKVVMVARLGESPEIKSVTIEKL
jgi:hypothetical protein